MRRALMWLLPPARRVWIEALWAESREVPSGRRRLAWQAGAVPLIAKDVLAGLLRPDRLLLVLAGGLVTWISWSGPAGDSDTMVNRVDAIATVAGLLVLTVVARRALGPVRDWWLAKVLRAGVYAAILAIVAIEAVIGRFMYTAPLGGELLRLYQFQRVDRSVETGPVTSVFLMFMAAYVIAVLWMTSSRAQVGAQVGKAALAIGTGTGIVTGVVLYLTLPLGIRVSSGGIRALNPLLPDSAVFPFAVLSVTLVLGVPIAALLAGWRRHSRPLRRHVDDGRFNQGIIVGLLANLVAALLVTCLGAATIALSFHSAAVSDWLYRGQHLAADAAYVRDLRAGIGRVAYVGICIAAPLFALLAGAAGGGFGWQTLAEGEPPGMPDAGCAGNARVR